MPTELYSILYIEDNESNRLLIDLILQRKEYLKLICAEDGASGIKIAKEQSPDLILLDISLPDMDGHEVLAKLRLDPSTADIPVVAISGNYPLLYPADATCKFDNFLGKPVKIDPLLTTIDTLISVNKK